MKPEIGGVLLLIKNGTDTAEVGRVDCRRNVVVGSCGSDGGGRRGVGGIGSEGAETLVKVEAKWELIDDNMSISNDCHTFHLAMNEENLGKLSRSNLNLKMNEGSINQISREEKRKK